MPDPIDETRAHIAKVWSAELGGILEAVTGTTSVAKKLERFDDGLGLLVKQTAGIDPTGDDVLFDEIGREARAAADVVRALQRQINVEDGDVLGPAVEFGGAIAALADLVAEAGGSLSASASPEGRDELAIQEVFQLREDADGLARELAEVGHVVLQSAGDTSFDWGFAAPHVPLSPGRCGGTLARLPVVWPDVEPDPEAPFTLYEPELLKLQLKLLGELLERLILWLIAVAAILPAGWIFCSHDCTPNTWRATLVNSGARWAGNRLQPWITLRWDYCCQNRCWIRWREEFWKNAGQTTHDVGPPFNANRGKQARGAAARHGRRAAARINAGMPIPLPGGGPRPPIVTPAPPGC